MSQELGSYRLISRLGAGGMGEVWRAEDTKLLRSVALKILPQELAKDPEWKGRFLREARTIAQLNHPNIATIYAIEEHEETLFIAMELVEGESLSAIISRGPLAPDEAVRVAVQTAEALGEAHAKGIIHRDIKPDNILVSPKVVKVLDFGIAKQIGGTADPSLTQGGMVLGTPHYMSPEQALGREIDARTDIFSLGVVLYEMLTGLKPFHGQAITEVMLQIVMNDARDIELAAPGVPRDLAEVVRRCMKKEPSQRYASCEEVRQALLAANTTPASRMPQARVQTMTSAPVTETPRSPASRPQPQVVPMSQPPQPAAAPQPRAKYRALIADDDPAARFILAGIMKKNQIAFDEVDNGADAVKKMKTTKYGIVFIDLLMPRVDGWGVLDYLRSRRSEDRPRVFIVTGVQNQKLSTADQDIVSGLLFKPIDIAAIERIVTA